MQIKIDVLSSGDMLLNGEPTDLARLAEAIGHADPSTDYVHYQRENPAGEAPSVSRDIMKMAAARKLAVSLAPKPRGLVIFAADGRVAQFPMPPPPPNLAERVRMLPKLFASEGSRNLAVIADTSFIPAGAAFHINDASQAIPFFGFLIGYTYAGHNVWVFNGEAKKLGILLGEADALLVDSAILPSLRPDWLSIAHRAMNPGANVFLHDRATYQLRQLALTK